MGVPQFDPLESFSPKAQLGGGNCKILKDQIKRHGNHECQISSLLSFSVKAVGGLDWGGGGGW